MQILWQWSRMRDKWVYVTACCADDCKKILRGYKRRNPKGTQFRWRGDGDGPPVRKYRKRTVKER